jgi:hypothetical protein
MHAELRAHICFTRVRQWRWGLSRTSVGPNAGMMPTADFIGVTTCLRSYGYPEPSRGTSTENFIEVLICLRWCMESAVTKSGGWTTDDKRPPTAHRRAGGRRCERPL